MISKFKLYSIIATVVLTKIHLIIDLTNMIGLAASNFALYESNAMVLNPFTCASVRTGVSK